MRRRFPVPLKDNLPKLTSRSCSFARCSSSRPLYYAFAELPSPQDYPDYYRMIKKPISYAEIKEKLDQSAFPLPRWQRLNDLTVSRAVGYSCLSEIRNDFNQMYVNAKRYNAPGSPLFLDAKRQHVSLAPRLPCTPADRSFCSETAQRHVRRHDGRGQGRRGDWTSWICWAELGPDVR